MARNRARGRFLSCCSFVSLDREQSCCCFGAAARTRSAHSRFTQFLGPQSLHQSPLFVTLFSGLPTIAFALLASLLSNVAPVLGLPYKSCSFCACALPHFCFSASFCFVFCFVGLAPRGRCTQHSSKYQFLRCSWHVISSSACVWKRFYCRSLALGRFLELVSKHRLLHLEPLLDEHGCCWVCADATECFSDYAVWVSMLLPELDLCVYCLL